MSANLGRVLGFLWEWDRADSKARRRILEKFVAQNSGMSFCELELCFAHVPSLFLARLTTWMRLTYMVGTVLGLQLRAIGIFLSASSHDQFVVEFAEDGGVFTLLDILSHSQIQEETKARTLRLLLVVSNTGSRFKELICESHGPKTIVESLSKSNTAETEDAARALLESLSHGNPKYHNQIYNDLISLMTCSSPKAQQLVLHTLRTIQSKMKTTHHSIVEPLLKMLRSLHPEVQDEAINLILDLKDYDVRPVLLSSLVALLKSPVDENRDEAEISESTGSLAVYFQQANAAKAIRLLAEESQDICNELLSLGVIQCLLYAVGNKEHVDAQIQATRTLKHFILSVPEHVQRDMGGMQFEASGPELRLLTGI